MGDSGSGSGATGMSGAGVVWRPAGGPEAQAFLRAVRRAAWAGRRRLCRPVRCDYQLDEVHRGAGRLQAVLRLTGVRARVEVSFPLPAGELDGRFRLDIDTRRGQGCWLAGAGIDEDDPLDVMEHAVVRAPPGELLQLVVAELLEGHRFRTLAGWGEMTRLCEAHSFRYRLGGTSWRNAAAGEPAREGLTVTFFAELEAYR